MLKIQIKKLWQGHLISIRDYDLVKAHDDGKPHWCKEHNRMESGNHEKATIEKDIEGGGTPHLGWFEVKSTDKFFNWIEKQGDIDAVTANAMDQAYPGWREEKEEYGDKWDKMKEKIKDGYRKMLRD